MANAQVYGTLFGTRVLFARGLFLGAGGASAESTHAHVASARERFFWRYGKRKAEEIAALEGAKERARRKSPHGREREPFHFQQLSATPNRGEFFTMFFTLNIIIDIVRRM